MRVIKRSGAITIWGEAYSSSKRQENLPGNLSIQAHRSSEYRSIASLFRRTAELDKWTHSEYQHQEHKNYVKGYVNENAQEKLASTLFGSEYLLWL